MIPFRATAIAAIALAASAGFALAQTQDDHAAHHAAQSAAQGGMPAQNQHEDQGGMTGPGMDRGMMGPGMKDQGTADGGTMPMMRMMQGMMQTMQGMMQVMQGTGQPSAASGMTMRGAQVENRIAFLKTELGITDAQRPQWDAFADALLARAKAMMQGMPAPMMRQGAASWPDRIAQHEQWLTAHLDALKAMEGPTKALWDALSDGQRRKAEELMPGPAGMM